MPPLLLRRRARRLAALASALTVWAPAVAHADWTTYRGDAARSGIDSSSVGSLPFTPAWTSSSLGGDVYAEPLVHNGLVIVGTESDQVWALDESTGQVVWQASAGTPVPSGQLPCGDISPTVGITSTPVIDPATNRVFAVADTWDGSHIQHKLFAFNVSNGSGVPGFPVSVEPPGDVPAAQLQRAALALVGGEVIIGYGGNAGDCGTYHGWLIAVPEAGGAARTFEVDPAPGADEGAIWGSGDGPAVDSAGDVWVSTGNGDSGSTYGYQESVLKLDPNMSLLDHWAPSNWQSLDSSDLDLGSSEPLLLPSGLVFEIGKQGLGYLLSASSLGGTGAAPAYEAPVCSGSWGGGVYSGGIVYVACVDGVRALALNPSARSFSPLAGWHVNSGAIGPAIIAGGLVWATDWKNATLYGLNLQTGQAVVTQSTPAMDHFATPSASDGKLFLATKQTVEAYTIADPAPVTTSEVTTPATPTASPGTCVLKLAGNRVKVHHPKRRAHHKHAPPAYGTVRVFAKCSQNALVRLSGTVTERLKNPKHARRRTRTLHVSSLRIALRAGVAKALQLRLGPAALLALEHRIQESGVFTLTAASASGQIHARARAAKLRL